MKRCVVVVGANRGIGLALAAKLAARGDSVIGTCRTVSDELRALGVEVIEGVDTASADSVAAFVRQLRDRRIDVLAVVAAVMKRVELDDLDFETIRHQFEVNALGPLRVASALAPRMLEGAKIFFLTSRMGSIGDNSSGGHYGYRMSKAALNMAGRSLARDLRSRGILVGMLHPGFVRTAMTGHQGEVTAEHAAAQLVERMEELSSGTSGELLHANGERLPW